MDGATPASLPVRIRLHPKMQATAKVKMNFAVQGEASFSAQRPQTTYFAHRDASVIGANQSAARSLLTGATGRGHHPGSPGQPHGPPGCPSDPDPGLRRGSYRFHADSELTSELLVKYIDGQVKNGALERWNVVVMGVKNRKANPAPGAARGQSVDQSIEVGALEHATARRHRNTDVEA